MKSYKNFINEDKEYTYTDYLYIKEYVVDVLKNELKKLEVGNEGMTVSTIFSGDNIPGIGKRSDYELEDGSYSHIIVIIRMFYGNSDFINKFDSISDFGKHLIKIEDKIKSTFKVEKIANYEEYFAYLIPITNDIRNASISVQTIDKFNL